MPTLSNERLCKLAQAGDTAARDILLENNLGFIRKIALEQYRSMGLDENDIGIDLEDLVQEGSIGLLNAIPLFDAGRGMKFLTYTAPAIRNAMTDCIRAALAQFEQRMVDKKDGHGFQRVYLDDVLSDDERMLRIEAICFCMAQQFFHSFDPLLFFSGALLQNVASILHFLHLLSKIFHGKQFVFG